MTTEREFGRFTQCELDAAVEQALEEQRGSRCGAAIVWLLIGAIGGCVWTLVVQFVLHCFNRSTM